MTVYSKRQGQRNGLGPLFSGPLFSFSFAFHSSNESFHPFLPSQSRKLWDWVGFADMGVSFK
jgi:hypothetical protein